MKLLKKEYVKCPYIPIISTLIPYLSLHFAFGLYYNLFCGSARWDHQPRSTAPRTSEVHCSFILQDTYSLWYKYSWWILCSPKACRRLSSSAGNHLEYDCVHDVFKFNNPVSSALSAHGYISLCGYSLTSFSIFRICLNSHHGRNWLLVIFMAMNGISDTFFEVWISLLK